MLKAEHIRAGYGNKVVIQDFSSDFKEGKLYIILGRNGSGKSTLLSILGGWMKPQSGSVLYNGKNLLPLSAMERARITGRIADDTLNVQMSVQRFVELGDYAREESRFSRFWKKAGKTDLSGMQSEDAAKRAQDAMRALSIDALATHRLDEVSAGERQKAAIAQVLVQNPHCLFLDEPGANLDPSARFELMDLLCMLKDPSRILVVVAHDLDLALRYADEILVLDGHQKVFQGSAIELAQSDLLQEVFEIRLNDWDPSTRTARLFLLRENRTFFTVRDE
ncbi:MAG: ABC transporter ATP-binding protein [Allobaculum sp.]|uniref:ABC transporter ATP-binding protein n=1 Tax=Allobaculum sp. TaxID=1872463 RepID=UPI003999583C